MARLAVRGGQALLIVVALYGLTALPDFAARWGLSPLGLVVILVWVALAGVGVWRLGRGAARRDMILLAGLLAAARLGFALLGVGRVSSGDPNSYLDLAKGLIAGQGLRIFEPYFGSVWVALFPPLYPLVLAAWGAVAGFSTPSILLLGTLVDLGAAWLIVALGTRLGDAATGRRAAWLYLVWPSVLFSAPLAQKEGLCVVLILALAIGWIDRRPGWRGALAIGLPAGLLALAQPGEAPLAALFGLVLIGRIGLGAVLRSGLSAVPVAVLVLLPWWVRNALVLGAFVPLTSASGASLWIGNNPDATGNWEPPPPGLRGIPELAYNKRIGAIATEWIRTHPTGFIRLTATKFIRAVAIGEFGIVRLVAMRPPLPLALAAALWPLSQLAHLALLGGAALRLSARRVPPLLLLLLLACLLQLILFGVWFEFGERHREFVTPFLLLLACTMFRGQPVENPAPTP